MVFYRRHYGRYGRGAYGYRRSYGGYRRGGYRKFNSGRRFYGKRFGGGNYYKKKYFSTLKKQRYYNWKRSAEGQFKTSLKLMYRRYPKVEAGEALFAKAIEKTENKTSYMRTAFERARQKAAEKVARNAAYRAGGVAPAAAAGAAPMNANPGYVAGRKLI